MYAEKRSIHTWGRARGRSRGAHRRIEPSRSAAHQRGPAGGQHGLYAFVSPDEPDTVTLIANWIPFEEPAGGPNFYKFGDDVLYDINIDNDGDAEDDIVYEFRFKTRHPEPATRSCTTPGRSTSLDDPELQHPADLHGHADRSARPPTVLGARPGDAAGQRRPALDAELRRAGGRGRPHAAGRLEGVRRPARRPVLRRPRLGLRPARPAAVQRGARDPAADRRRASTALKGFNTHTIAFQVPKRC